MEIFPSSGGAASPPEPNPAYVFSVSDVLTTTDNALIPWLPGRGTDVSAAFAQVKTAPTGAAINVLIKLIDGATGATVSTLGTVVIAAGSLQSAVLSFALTAVPQNYSLAAEISQVGSTIAGANLTVEVYGPGGVASFAGPATDLQVSGPLVLPILSVDDGDYLARIGAAVVGVRINAGSRVASYAAQLVPAATLTPLTFDTPRWDTNGFIVGSSFIVPAGLGGLYLVGGCAAWDADPNGFRQLTIRLNGAIHVGGDRIPALPADPANVNFSTVVPLVGGDVLELMAYQSAPGALNTVPSNAAFWTGVEFFLQRLARG